MHCRFDISNGERPGFGVGNPLCVDFGMLHLFENCSGLFEKQQAFPRQPDTLTYAFKQGETQPCFELDDLPAQWRLGDVQPLRSLTNILSLGHGDKGT